MKLKITLMKSTIGRHENQIRTVKAVKHLVSVEEIAD